MSFTFFFFVYINSIPQNHTCCYTCKNVKNESLLKGLLSCYFKCDYKSERHSCIKLPTDNSSLHGFKTTAYHTESRNRRGWKGPLEAI